MAKGNTQDRKSLRDEHAGAVPLTGSTGELHKWESPGQQIEGRFVNLKDGSMGGQIVTLDTGKELISASAPQMLASALADVAPGTWVIIRYLGEAPSKKGGTYKTFEAVAIPKK